NLAWGFHSSAFGLGIRAMSYAGTAIGRYNVGDPLDIFSEWNENDVLFEIGNGTDNNNRSNAVTVLKNGNVGFGPSAPTASFHVDAVNGVLFDGATTGSIPVEGSGSRMMWYQGKSAFRAGSVQTQWDDVNIGSYSAALNFRTTASGTYSFATGYQTEASGQRATAMGSSTIASGLHSTALGSSSEATGDYSTVIGRNVKSSGNGTIFIGDNSSASIQQANTDNRFAARFANGYRFFTTSDLTVGAKMDAGDNSWTVTSDSTKKENFKTVDGEKVLNEISKFRLTSWNYKTQDPAKFRHYGPMAQDFYAAFGNDGIGTIGNDTTIASADFDGINFIAIQALEKRSKDQLSKIQNLESRIRALEAQNQELAKINAAYRTENAKFRQQNLEFHKNLEQIKEAIHIINIQNKNVNIALSK
ncbi:MAG: tail fiber domain-containing protein, partial [Melioribacteraceae bacterium]|nr:tail fiber domain-containing protein [Melioribacteraceae bacterium]